MKISITLHGKTYSIEEENNLHGDHIEEMVEHFKGLLVSAGYHPNSVDQCFNTEYQWFNEVDDVGVLEKLYPSGLMPTPWVEKREEVDE